MRLAACLMAVAGAWGLMGSPPAGRNGRGAKAQQSAGASGDALPRLMFWAWEQREDMRPLAPRDGGVAFLGHPSCRESHAVWGK
jgi:hypothetical protein